MMYYFKTAPLGFASDGTAIADPSLHIQPLIKVFNSMNYDAMTLGNHEFNFGKEVFKSVLGQATFPLLQANVSDSGAYGLTAANIMPSITKTMGAENINVAIIGIGNHRVPFYELPANIPGLTFSDPLAKTQELSTALRPNNDVVIALSHIGFTENPSSIEVDTNVDTRMAAMVTGIDAIIGGHSHTDPSRQTPASGSYLFLPSIVADPEGKPVLINQAYRYNNYLGEVVLGLKSKRGSGYEVVSQTGRYISVSLSGTAEDAAIKAIIDPYQTLLSSYNATVVGQTTAPLDSLTAFTQETNGANLQADASVAKLSHEGIAVDVHLSGAVTNRKIAVTATPATPYSLTVADLFNFIPYENSLVVLSMNGPQLKAVLERAYRNYYYYKYVPGYGGYSYYTTGMLVPDAGSEIVYYDGYPDLPNGNNVVSLQIHGRPVNFNDAATYYHVSTLNYLAAGNCNFNNGGTTIWPLDQITDNTQYYVRDAVIDYIKGNGTINPTIDGRLQFTAIPPSPISLTRPNGGESWGRNSRQVIRWNAAAGLGNLRISLWQNSTQIGIIADNVNPADGSYIWNVGAYVGGVAPLGTGYTIRIREKGTALGDQSDGPFSIVKISVKTPNGGESWQIGSTQNITWVTKIISSNLRIVLFKNGVKVGNIANSIDPALSAYSWTVGNYVGGTAAAGSGYQVQVREIGTDAGDRSDANFTLTAP